MSDSSALSHVDPAVQDPSFVVRWVLAHEPVAVFEKASRRFGELIRERTGRRMDVRVLTCSEFGKGTPVSPLNVAGALMQGKLEMTQTYTPLLGLYAFDLWALDLPFLFRDHAHAARVLDGAVGQRLMRGLRRFGVRGLAFTYSGGYRLIAAKDRQIRRWEDFAGLRLRTSHSPVAVRLIESLGAEPIPSPAESIVALAQSGEIDSAETTYPRYWALDQGSTLRTLNETWHSLFLTVMAVSDRFYASLPPAYQQALESAAREVAVMERAQSVADGEMARRGALERGMTVVTMSEDERRRFARRTEPLYEQFAPLFGRDLLDALRQG